MPGKKRDNYAVHERDLWRQPDATTTAVACLPVTLTTGTVVVDVTKTLTLGPQAPATFTPYCPDGKLPIPIMKRPTVLQFALASEMGVSIDALPFSNWQTSFDMDAVPSYITLGSASAIAWAVMVAIVSSPRQSPVLKVITFIAAVCMTIATGELMHVVYEQYRRGYVDGFLLIDVMTESYIEAVPLFLANTAALVAQVWVVARLFARKKEKRLIWIMGLVLTVITQVLWGFEVFVPGSEDNNLQPSVLAVMPVLAYLFSITDAVLFSSCVLVYGISYWRLAYRYDILALAVVSHLCMLGPIVLFIIDVADTYIENWSRYANTSSLIIAAVAVSVWVDRIENMKKRIESNSVLGRPVFEEDADSVEDTDVVVHGKTINLTPADSSETDVEAARVPRLIVSGDVQHIPASNNSSGSDTAVGRSEKDGKGREVQDTTTTAATAPATPLLWTRFVDVIKWIKNVKRPESSSSVSTTYVVRPDTSTPVDALQPSATRSSDSEPLKVHTYPPRRNSSRATDDD